MTKCERRNANDEVRTTKYESGITVVAVLLTVFLLAALGAGMVYFISSGQKTSVQQVSGDQAFYSVQAGMEFGLGKVLREGSADTSFSPTFSGETLSITRASNVMTVAAPEEEAYATHSITDPTPIDCLIVDTSDAEIEGNNKLEGLTFRRDPSCTGPMVMTSMTGTSWIPVLGQLNQILFGFDPPNEFTGPPDESGGTFDFTNTYTVNDGVIKYIDRIQWNSNINDRIFHLVFIYNYDGGTYSESVDLGPL